LTTRPIAGVDWTVDTAFVYNKELHPKTVPVLARHLKRRLAVLPIKTGAPQATGSTTPKVGSAKRPPSSEDKDVRSHPSRRFA
jgi:hypothetical protein